MFVCSYDMSAGRWDSRPDSRSMPTVDLQWWLSSTDVFCTGRKKTKPCFKHTAMQSHTQSSAVRCVPGRGMPGGVWSWWGRAGWLQDGPRHGQLLPSDPEICPEDSGALPAATQQRLFVTHDGDLTYFLQPVLTKTGSVYEMLNINTVAENDF